VEFRPYFVKAANHATFKTNHENGELGRHIEPHHGGDKVAGIAFREGEEMNEEYHETNQSFQVTDFEFGNHKNKSKQYVLVITAPCLNAIVAIDLRQVQRL
jgi:hypothetical protein